MKYIFSFILSVIYLIVPAQVNLPAYIPANGLVGFWPFNGNANDVGPHSNYGGVNGAQLTADRFSNPLSAYSFNGTSDYISIPDDPALSGFNDMSISLWVNMNTFNNTDPVQNLVTKWYQQLNCGSNSDTYTAAMLNDYVEWNTNNNNVSLFSSPPQLTLGQWYHLVFTSSNTLGEAIYVNGVLMATNPTTGGICSSTNDLYFGAGFDGNQNIVHRFLSGKLDDIGIWSRVLNLCEIKQLYTASTITVSVTSSNPVLCHGQSATLTASGASTYSWSGSVNFPALPAQVISPTVTTVYTVTGTSTLTGCSQTRTITQVVSECTNLAAEHVQNKMTVHAYPNPAGSILNLDLAALSKDQLSVLLEDISGKPVLRYDHSGLENESHLQLNTDQLENGLYLIRILNSEAQTLGTERIIILK